MSHVSDTDHCRLEAIVRPDCIIESHEISDAARGWRRVPVTKLWRTERLLGRGGYGEVYLQSLESDRKEKRALKVIPTRGLTMSLADCQRELVAMTEFKKHKYREAAVFVDFFGWFRNDDAMFLAMEYMVLGDLEQNLQEIENCPTHDGPALAEDETQEITRQILEGLKIMHAEGFAHRDLKPQNVFVVQKKPQWWVKLGDFGLSKQRTDQTAFRTHAGTQQYMAPELFHYVPDLEAETSEYTNAIDIWALGCIIYRIIVGAVPFPSLLSLRNYCRDPLKVPLNIPHEMENARRYVEELLRPNPAKRPLASAALTSTWLSQKAEPNVSLQFTFNPINLSASQNNYNTATHKGLQSNFSMPTAILSPQISFNKRSILESSRILSRSPIGGPSKSTSLDQNDPKTQRYPQTTSSDPRALIQKSASPSPGPSAADFTNLRKGPETPTIRQDYNPKPTRKSEQGDTTIAKYEAPNQSLLIEAQSFNSLGDAAMKDQDYVNAIEFYGAALKVVPGSSTYLYNQAWAYNFLGNTIMSDDLTPDCCFKAIECYSKALDLSPGNFIFLCNRATSYLICGKYEAAYRDAKASVTANPKWPMSWISLGRAELFWEKGDAQRSVDAYEKAIECGNRELTDVARRELTDAERNLREQKERGSRHGRSSLDLPGTDSRRRGEKYSYVGGFKQILAAKQARTAAKLMLGSGRNSYRRQVD